MCAPCGFIPNNTHGCQDYGNPHAAEAGESTDYPIQPAMPRMGRISTFCCGWDFGTVAEKQAHLTQH